MREKNDFKSLLMLVCSMLIFGTIGIFRKYIPLSSGILAAFRGISGALFLLGIVGIKRLKLNRSADGYGKTEKQEGSRLRAGQLVGLVLAGGAMGLNWMLLFEAYNYTSVATATMCYYMEPTIFMLMTPFVFKERLTARKLFCVAVSLAGMVFVSGMIENGMPGADDARGIICGLGAAVLYAIVVTINKKLSGIDAYKKTIIELLAAAVVLVPYLAATEDFTGIELDVRAVILMLVVGLVHTGLAYALYFGSMDGLKNQSIAIISYIDPVSALILSALILHEPMTVFGVIGAVLILAAALYGETEKQKKETA